MTWFLIVEIFLNLFFQFLAEIVLRKCKIDYIVLIISQV